MKVSSVAFQHRLEVDFFVIGVLFGTFVMMERPSFENEQRAARCRKLSADTGA